MTPRPTERSRGAVFGAGHLVRRAVDEVLQHVVEEAHHVLDELLVAVPLVPGFDRLSEDRQHTAVRSLPRWSGPVGSVISLHRFEVGP
jgi:hypothetical protein